MEPDTNDENPFTVWTEGEIANQIEASPRFAKSRSFFADEPESPGFKRMAKKFLPMTPRRNGGGSMTPRKNVGGSMTPRRNAGRRSSVSTVSSNGELTEIQTRLKSLQVETVSKSLQISKLEKQLTLLRESVPSETYRISEKLVDTMEMQREVSSLRKQVTTTKEDQVRRTEQYQASLDRMTKEWMEKREEAERLEKTAKEQSTIIEQQRNEITRLQKLCDVQTDMLSSYKQNASKQAEDAESQNATQFRAQLTTLEQECKEKSQKIVQLETSLSSAKAIAKTQAEMIDQLQDESSQSFAHQTKKKSELELTALEERINETKERVLRRENDFKSKLQAKTVELQKSQSTIKALKAELASAKGTNDDHPMDEEQENQAPSTDELGGFGGGTKSNTDLLSSSLLAMDPAAPSNEQIISAKPAKKYYNALGNSTSGVASARGELHQSTSGKPVFSGTASVRKSRYHKWKRRHAILLQYKDCYQLRLMSTEDSEKRAAYYNIHNSKARVDQYLSGATHSFTLRLILDINDSKGSTLLLSVQSKEEFDRWYEAFSAATATGSLGDDLTEAESNFMPWKNIHAQDIST